MRQVYIGRAGVASLWSIFLLSSALALGEVGGVQHMVIIGIDGLSPRGIVDSQTPNFHKLMEEGAYTLHARAVIPTVSSPNWASIIMGAGPAQHGITSNAWERDKFEIIPTAKGPEGIFPTIFGVLHQARPDANLCVFHDWEGFGRLVEKQSVNVVEHPIGAPATAHRAIDYIKQNKPLLTFIHFDHVDHAGHQMGWYTDAYNIAVQIADKLIGEVLDGIKDAGIQDSTIVLITADHGGKGKGHGGSTMEEIEIPWIISGPGVAKGKEITDPVNTYDTAATVVYIFGVKPHPAWIAKPVLQAFVLSPPSQTAGR